MAGAGISLAARQLLRSARSTGLNGKTVLITGGSRGLRHCEPEQIGRSLFGIFAEEDRERILG